MASTHDNELTTHKHSTTAPRLLAGDGQVKLLPLNSLISLEESGIPFGKEAMRKVNDDNVTSIAQADENAIPPIKVVNTSIGTVITDGYHRQAAMYERLHMRAAEMHPDDTDARARALEALQNEAMIATIAESYNDYRSVINAAFQANLSHGYTLNKQGRTKYALWLLDEAQANNEKLGIRAAARMAGIVHSTLIEALQRRAKKGEKELPEGAKEDLPTHDVEELEHPTPEEKPDNETENLMAAFAKSARHVHALLSSMPEEDATALIMDYLKQVPDLAVIDYLGKTLTATAKVRREREEKQRKAAEAELKRVQAKKAKSVLVTRPKKETSENSSR